jgi:hypothetical protein
MVSGSRLRRGPPVRNSVGSMSISLAPGRGPDGERAAGYVEGCPLLGVEVGTVAEVIGCRRSTIAPPRTSGCAISSSPVTRFEPQGDERVGEPSQCLCLSPGGPRFGRPRDFSCAVTGSPDRHLADPLWPLMEEASTADQIGTDPHATRQQPAALVDVLRAQPDLDDPSLVDASIARGVGGIRIGT